MKHIFRFLGERQADGRWQLHGKEVHHATKVLRLTSGETVEVTDGAGRWARGSLVLVGSTEAQIEVRSEQQEAAPARRLTLALAAVKSQDMELTIASAVEVGVDDVIVFRLQGDPSFRLGAKQEERWRQAIGQAIKQSKRAWLPTLRVVDDLAAVCNQLPASSHGLYLDPESPSSLQASPLGGEGDVWLVLGSEKGLGDGELTILQKNGFVGASLGPHIQRARTAAILGAGTLAMRLAHRENNLS